VTGIVKLMIRCKTHHIQGRNEARWPRAKK